MPGCWGLCSWLLKLLKREDGEERYQLTDQQRSQITHEWLNSQQLSNLAAVPRPAARQAVPAQAAGTRSAVIGTTRGRSPPANPTSVLPSRQNTGIVEGSSAAVGREQSQQQRESTRHPTTAENTPKHSVPPTTAPGGNTSAGLAEASSPPYAQTQLVTTARGNAAERGSDGNTEEILGGQANTAGHRSDGSAETLTESDAGSIEDSLSLTVSPAPRPIPENWTVPQAIERLQFLRARVTFTDQQVADLFKGLEGPPRWAHEDTSLTRRLATLHAISEMLVVYLRTFPVGMEERDEIRDIIGGLEACITGVQAALDELATRLERTTDPNLGEKLRQSFSTWASLAYREALDLEERMLFFTRRLPEFPTLHTIEEETHENDLERSP